MLRNPQISGILCIVAVLCLAPAVFGQGSAALMIGEYYPKFENHSIFDTRAAELLANLRKADAESTAFINIYSNSDLAAQLNKLTEKEPALRERISLLKPGLRYQDEIDHVSFWILPKGAGPPMLPQCALCDCPTISASGEAFLFDGTRPKESVTFTANVSGSATVTYTWSVTNGKISDGQWTGSIKVVPDGRWDKDVVAKIEIGGLDPACMCMTEAEQTVSFIKPRP